MKKTLYYMRMPDGTEYYMGDKILRIISIVLHTLELATIIYLILR